MATKLNPLSYVNFWEEATAQEFGLRVECESEDDKRLLVNALYECRKQAGRWEEMMIFQPTTNVLFIAKKLVKEMPL